jgi:hypothetical protein
MWLGANRPLAGAQAPTVEPTQHERLNRLITQYTASETTPPSAAASRPSSHSNRNTARHSRTQCILPVAPLLIRIETQQGTAAHDEIYDKRVHSVITSITITQAAHAQMPRGRCGGGALPTECRSQPNKCNGLQSCVCFMYNKSKRKLQYTMSKQEERGR